MSEKPIGLVGLGAMGLGMAKSLRRAGYNVHVFDIRGEVAEGFAAEGGVVCSSPAEMAAAVRSGDQRGGQCGANGGCLVWRRWCGGQP